MAMLFSADGTHLTVVNEESEDNHNSAWFLSLNSSNVLVENAEITLNQSRQYQQDSWGAMSESSDGTYVFAPVIGNSSIDLEVTGLEPSTESELSSSPYGGGVVQGNDSVAVPKYVNSNCNSN
jgi:hypothetical protein